MTTAALSEAQQAAAAIVADSFSTTADVVLAAWEMDSSVWLPDEPLAARVAALPNRDTVVAYFRQQVQTELGRIAHERIARSLPQVPKRRR